MVLLETFGQVPMLWLAVDLHVPYASRLSSVPRATPAAIEKGMEERCPCDSDHDQVLGRPEARPSPVVGVHRRHRRATAFVEIVLY